MNVLESILNFLTTLARIIFPRRKRPVAGDNPCPHPLPAPAEPAGPTEGGDGDRPDSLRGDTLALQQGDWGRDAAPNMTQLMGCCLMMAGGVGCLLKHWL